MDKTTAMLDVTKIKMATKRCCPVCCYHSAKRATPIANNIEPIKIENTNSDNNKDQSTSNHDSAKRATPIANNIVEPIKIENTNSDNRNLAQSALSIHDSDNSVTRSSPIDDDIATMNVIEETVSGDNIDRAQSATSSHGTPPIDKILMCLRVNIERMVDERDGPEAATMKKQPPNKATTKAMTKGVTEGGLPNAPKKVGLTSRRVSVPKRPIATPPRKKRGRSLVRCELCWRQVFSMKIHMIKDHDFTDQDARIRSTLRRVSVPKRPIRHQVEVAVKAKRKRDNYPQYQQTNSMQTHDTSDSDSDSAVATPPGKKIGRPRKENPSTREDRHQVEVAVRAKRKRDDDTDYLQPNTTRTHDTTDSSQDFAVATPPRKKIGRPRKGYSSENRARSLVHCDLCWRQVPYMRLHMIMVHGFMDQDARIRSKALLRAHQRGEPCIPYSVMAREFGDSMETPRDRAILDRAMKLFGIKLGKRE